MKLTPEQKKGLFAMLATKTLYETGLEYGFDKHYKDPKAIKGAVNRVYADLKNNPEKNGIDKAVYELVVDAVSNRSAVKPAEVTSLKEKGEVDIKTMILSNRDKLATLLSKKLDDIGSSKKKLAAVSLPQISIALCQIFDKGQIVQGQATEHIAHLSKIEEGLSAKDLLAAVLSQRENIIIKKNE